MRAYEFINEGQEYWEKLETPEITQARADMSNQMRVRGITAGPQSTTSLLAPPKKTPYPTFPDSPLAKPPVAKKQDPFAGYPGDFKSGYPSRVTPKMIEPISGVVQLGPNKFVQPGTEEYAQLKQQVDPVDGTIHYFRKPTAKPSPEVEKKLQQRNQEFIQQFKPNTLDKGKEIIWPSRKDPKYYMVDPAREKYRT
jgi:hypothetical protein